MKRFFFVFVTLTVGASTACVSQGTYDKLQADLDATRANLKAVESERDGCVAREATCQTDKNAAEEAIRKSEAKLAGLLKDNAQMDASIEDMKAALAELARSKRVADRRIAEFRALVDKFRALIDAGRLKVKIVNGRMVVELATDVLFGSGSARLSKEGKAAIIEVAQLLQSIEGRQFQVEGHTDNVPISTQQYPSNWELASDRAISVVKTMLEAGMPSDRISASSAGEWRPVQSNDTKPGKAANRRIEIVIVPDLSGLPGFDELNRLAQ